MHYFDDHLPHEPSLTDLPLVFFTRLCLQCFDAVGWVAGMSSDL